MMRPTYDPLDGWARNVAASCARDAVSRFRDQLGDQDRFAQEVAQAAAENAIEQYRALVNGELRLIRLEYQRRADMLALTPPHPVIIPDKIWPAPTASTGKGNQ